LFDGNAVEARSRFKGVPDVLPEANEAAPVAAVSGACLMVDRALFEDVGGLRNIYAEGHAEDTDLCLRLRDAGRRNWYVPSARLYHLEGRSDHAPSGAVRQYNALLLDHLWGERLADLNEPPGVSVLA
jgi:GT2 family glycosyltransferase